MHNWNMKRRENGAEEIFEVNIGCELSKINDNKSQIQKAQRITRTINTEISKTKNIIFKLLKKNNKERKL